MKVFWSWQFDTPGKIGRHFVRNALNAAIEQLRQTPDVEEPTERETRSGMHLDQDRKGISGSPDLARVIFEKIEQSAVFVADVTPVGMTTAQKEETPPKKIVNPNVAIELGYAVHALSDRALLMVMNEHYGSRADLPFNLQSKAGPITFRLPPDADRKTITAASRQLTAELAEALELYIAQHVERIRQQTPFPEASVAHNSAMYFDPAEILVTFNYPPREAGYQFRFKRAAYIRLFPMYGKPRVGLAKLTPIFQARKPCPMSMILAGIAGRNRFGPIIYDPRGQDEIDGLTQGFETGELWGVNGNIFVEHELRDSRSGWIIPTIQLERLYVHVLTNYVRIARSELGLPLPYTVELGAIGLNEIYFTAPGLHGRGESRGPVMVDSFKRRYSLRDASDNSVKAVLATYFTDLYDLAAFSRKDVFTAASIHANELPPLEV